MKRKALLLPILTLALVALLAFTACNEEAPDGKTEAPTAAPTEATTDEPTEAPTDAPTEAPTAAPTDAPTDPATDAPTEAPTEAESERLYREDWDPHDPNNPYLNLIEVGTSYDGKTTCYDGRYDFGYTVCMANGVEYSSVQDAIDDLEYIGGDISIRADLNICLKLYIPDDECFYRIFFEFKNVDFVFNRGMIYDDCKPNDDGVRGFAYYSDLETLDGIMGLDNTWVWIIAPYDRFEPGRYVMIDEVVEDEDWWYMYNYQLDRGIDSWEGLPHGEILP